MQWQEIDQDRLDRIIALKVSRGLRPGVRRVIRQWFNRGQSAKWITRHAAKVTPHLSRRIGYFLESNAAPFATDRLLPSRPRRPLK